MIKTIIHKYRNYDAKIIGFRVFILLFYLIGIVGIFNTWSSLFFIKLTPLALILSTVILFLFHKNFNVKTFIAFFVVIMFGFIIEIIGVNTGYIFGEYEYGHTLGIKIIGTPIIIGINWLLMIYLSSSIFQFIKNRYLKIFFASIFMVIYDLILEQVAPKLDMWQFENGTAPIKNYVAWFIISIIFHTIFQFFKINTQNRLASTILIAQILFFGILLLL